MVDALTGRDPEAERRLADGLPIGRMGTPEEIAASILHLCSDAAGFTTGHALALDGGLTAG
jgi:NAD(P)-dependent dehydrogenase (short-subunit alcohol dehydrogenase family)